MSLTHRVLGAPGRDNALVVQVDSGQAVERLLFDCGDGCAAELPFAELQGIDGLFFSHLHMDHVGGFDAYFRAVYDRTSKPNRVLGPADTARILQHRFQGFLWNLHEAMSATWSVADVLPDRVRTSRFELREAFALAHDEGDRPYDKTIWEGAGYLVDAHIMDHRTPALAFVVREHPRRNVDTSRLASLGLKPGPWMKRLKEAGEGEVLVGGVARSLESLRQALVVETPGDALAYLTDFLLDEPTIERLADALKGVRTIVCEGQYRHADVELARKNHHMTTVLSATLARRAGAEDLVLFHLSDRYDRTIWLEMLREARAVFPPARFSAHWDLEDGPPG